MPNYDHAKVWLNGEIVPPEEAKISVFSQAVLRGSSVYEGIRAYWNEERNNLFLWKIDPHIRRLFDSMRVMRMTPPYTAAEFKDAVIAWIRANEFREDIHFRLNVYFDDSGPLDMKGYTTDEVDTCVFIIGGPNSNRRRQEQGVNLCVSSWRRISDDSVPPRVKASANYQNSRLAGVEARINGYDDALLLNQNGTVAEGTGTCTMIVRGGKLITPPVTASILESITRDSVLEMFGRHIGPEPVERLVDRTEIYVADEAMICGSAAEIAPVLSLDRIEVGDGKPGKVTRRLQEIFYTAARGVDGTYEKDILPVY